MLYFLSALNPSQQKDFRTFRNRFTPVIPKYLAIDGHRDAFFDPALHARVTLDDFTQQLPDGGGFDRNRSRSVGGVPERPRDVDLEHQSAAMSNCAFLMALRIRGGDIGTCVKRTPVAFDTALPMAANGGTIDVSPTPRMPYG